MIPWPPASCMRTSNAASTPRSTTEAMPVSKSARRRVIRSSRSRVDLPAVRHALQLVLAAVGELDPGAGHEVLDRPRDQHLVRAGERADACGDVHGDSADV